MKIIVNIVLLFLIITAGEELSGTLALFIYGGRESIYVHSNLVLLQGVISGLVIGIVSTLFFYVYKVKHYLAQLLTAFGLFFTFKTTYMHISTVVLDPVNFDYKTIVTVLSISSVSLFYKIFLFGKLNAWLKVVALSIVIVISYMLFVNEYRNNQNTPFTEEAVYKLKDSYYDINYSKLMENKDVGKIPYKF